MIVQHLGGGIVLIEDLLSKAELEYINLNLIEETCPVQGFKSVGEKKFLEGGYEIKDLKEDIPTFASRYSENIELLPFFDTVNDAMYRGAVQYCKIFPVAAESITNCVGRHFIKYVSGNFMGPHSDSSLSYKDGTIEPTSAIALGNTVTVSIILNDQFEGGSLLFNTWGIKVQPKAGSALYYPSNYIGSHQVDEVKSGTRWAFLAFYSHGDRTFVSNAALEKYPERYDWTMKFREDIKTAYKEDGLLDPNLDLTNLNRLQRKV
jgi:hypothetical protein